MRRLASKIHADEMAVNNDRLFGSAAFYYRAYLVTPEGEFPVAFTPADIAEAKARGANNREDFPPPTRGVWQTFVRWLRAR